uniref:DUF1173 family protein n=1 Tax=Acidovorax sp. SUPP3334 TaxID=2920881 RepID=UPI00295294D4|nr:DUF1173 family protein [Acidovorax sp. SUPP3334]BDH38368.1 DUF1173 domain-containing protein [Acidovorax sp. SUPP3334]
MQKYLFGSHIYSSEHESWQRILQKGYASKLRPVCLCLVQVQEGGPSLYIALSRGQYQLKRLPYSGPLHAPHCDHYEPPPELSGLGQVSGSAIREDLESETTTLTLDFALSKGRSRQAAAGSEVEHESVRNDGTKLTMRGLLHFLMDEAGLTRWTPAMQGRRSWYVIRRELLKASGSKMAKGQPLRALLHIPETFSTDRAQEIRQRQRESLARLAEATSARMILLGEVKAIEDARFGKSLIVKHMPDTKLMMTDQLHKHVLSRFAHQLQLWSQIETSHLMLLATMSRSAQGVMSIEAACFMNVNDQWLPFESLFEWELLDSLQGAHRRFTKGLRYNLPSSKPLASVVLQDTGNASTALFMVPQDAEGEYETAVAELAEQSLMETWIWRAGAEAMPPLPMTRAERDTALSVHQPPDAPSMQETALPTSDHAYFPQETE